MFENKRRQSANWSPKGGEFEVAPMLVDIDEITGGVEESDISRPDSGNMAAKKAMAAISMDFISGSPIRDEKMDALLRALPEEPVIPLFVED